MRDPLKTLRLLIESQEEKVALATDEKTKAVLQERLEDFQTCLDYAASWCTAHSMCAEFIRMCHNNPYPPEE